MKQPRKVDINQPAIVFDVIGDAVPKQSFRYGNGHGYTPDHVKAWAGQVAWAAAQAMTGRPSMTGPVRMRLDFYLENRRVRDCDNLSKNVLDACKDGGLYANDNQVTDLHIVKHYVKRGEGRVSVKAEADNASN